VLDRNEKIILTKPQNQLGPKPSVDLLFQSLANALHERVIGVILSGTGTDGAIGVRAIKKNGGFTLECSLIDDQSRGYVHHVLDFDQMIGFECVARRN
jgi:chemotaxis response regulator CheB